MTLFRTMADARRFDVDKLCDKLDVVPSELIIAGFDALRPAGRIADQVRLWDNMWNDDYVKGYRMMERWGAETLPLASEYFRQIVKQLMQGNALHEGTLQIGGRTVDLKRIKLPLLHVIAQHDHIVPPACAQPLMQRVRSRDKQEVMLPGGHVSLVAGRQCRQAHVARTRPLAGGALDMNDRHPHAAAQPADRRHDAANWRGCSLSDAQALAAFAAALPAHDLLFLRRDISQPKVIAAWMQAIAEGRLHSLAVREARRAGRLLGHRRRRAVLVAPRRRAARAGGAGVARHAAWAAC